jgi:hypothetical protein
MCHSASLLRALSGRAFAALLLSAFLPSAGRASIVLGQIDTFENGTTQRWGIGMPGPFAPVNIPTGGPAGAGDHYLQVTSNGSAGAGGRITVFNRDQWTGNYLAAGVNAVEMDLINLGTQPLSIRIALKRGIARTDPGFASTNPFVLPADGLWHHAVFLLDAADLTRLGSQTLTLDSLLSGVAEFRVLESAVPALDGERISAVVGIDNVQASAVPESAGFTLTLVGAGLLGLGRRLSRRQARGRSRETSETPASPKSHDFGYGL